MTQDIFEGEAYRCLITGCNTLLRMLKTHQPVEVQKGITDIDEKHASVIVENKHHCQFLESKPTMSKLLFGNTYDPIEERTKDLESGMYLYPDRC